MIKNGKYRFTLQFGMQTVEEEKAGQLLEQLGKRKSPLVVAAINEYLANHPDFLKSQRCVQFHVAAPDTQFLENLIQQIIEERLGCSTITQKGEKENNLNTGKLSSDILDMLNDLEYFA